MQKESDNQVMQITTMKMILICFSNCCKTSFSSNEFFKKNKLLFFFFYLCKWLQAHSEQKAHLATVIS